MLTIKNYVRAESLEEAYELNQKKSSRVIGGMLWMRLSNFNIQTAIDLSGLGLDTIEESPEEFSIGAMVTLRQLEEHQGLGAYTQGALGESLRHIVGVQFRNLATVGGSIWGRFGFSDVLTMFLALDTWVELYQGGLMPLEEFAQRRADRDILVRLILKKRPARCCYVSHRNTRTDFPVLAVSAVCLEGQYQVAVGARPGRAVLLRDQEKILEGGAAQGAEDFGRYAADRIPVGSNMRAQAEYRRHLCRVLTERAVREL